MLKKIHISSFRSIKDQTVELSKVNIFYGGTATGKSSILYAPFILKNFIRSPSLPLDALFNLGFINLGGFDACISNHNTNDEMAISLTTDTGSFELYLKKTGGRTRLKVGDIELTLSFPLPYALNQNVSHPYKYKNFDFTINWNGVHANVLPKVQTAQTQQIAHEIVVRLNSVTREINAIDIVPHRRGFFKPVYSPAQVSPIPWIDDEIATLIMNDHNLAPKISVDLEKIMNRDFRIHIPPGTATGYLKTTDKSIRMPTDLVNDGFGVNQIVYMLAKIHRPEIKVLFIEEPEVHLHPSVINKLVKVLISIAMDDEKQFLIVTHSEIFISSFLTAVMEGVISPQDLKVFFTTKEKKHTIFTEQSISESGQIEGGLKDFIEAEMEYVERLLLGNKTKSDKK